jgi:hypothetical protein
MLATDWASYVNPDGLQKLFTLLNVPARVNLAAPAPSISLHVAERIPNSAVAVALGSNLAQITTNSLAVGKAGAALSDLLNGTTSGVTGFDASYAQFQLALQAGFGLDLNNDVLSWLNGDFALYALVNNGPNTTISFTPVLLVQTPDTSKTDNFIIKINAGVRTLLRLPIAKNSDGLYNLTLPGADTINYGRVNDTFISSYGKYPVAALSALHGQGVLSRDTTWQAAAALAPPAFQHFWYINLTKLNALFKQASKPAQPDPTVALLSLFKSAVLYSTDLGGGSSLTTIVLLK